jgi:hypothetical protein
MRKLGHFAIVLAATGCQDRGGFGPTEARSAGDALAASIEAGAETFGPLTPGASADAACAVLSGDPTDTDGDNIPASGVLAYDCTATALGLTGTLTGTLSVTDDLPDEAAWAFTGEADLEASLTGAGGASIVTTRSGQLVATQASPLGPFALSHEVLVQTVFTSGGELGPPRSATVGENGAWTLTFTPQVAWTPGSLIVTGELEATGTWDVSVQNERTNAAVQATLSTPAPLVLDPTCETRVTAGTLVATYPSNRVREETIEVTWTGCGQRIIAAN